MSKAKVLESILKRLRSAKNAEEVLSIVDDVKKSTNLTGKDREIYLNALDEVYGNIDKRRILTGHVEPALHGTKKNFSEFKSSKNSDDVKTGSFFTEDPSFADAFSQSDKYIYGNSDALDEGANIMPVRLRTGKIFDYENPEHVQQVVAELKKLPKPKSKPVSNNDWSLDEPTEILPKDISEGFFDTIEDSRVQKILKKLGFDSYNVAEYHPNSTIDKKVKNIGVYDPSNIRSEHAAFDPRFKDSKNIMAGVAAIPAGANMSDDKYTNRLKEMGLTDEEIRDIEQSVDNSIDNDDVFPDTGREKEFFDNIESYSSAPVRKAIQSLHETKDIDQVYKDFINQFGKDPEKVKSYDEMYQNIGVSGAKLSELLPDGVFRKKDGDILEGYDMRPEEGGLLDITPSGTLGTITDMFNPADPLNIVSFKPIKFGYKKLKNLIKGSSKSLPELKQALKASDKTLPEVREPGKLLNASDNLTDEIKQINDVIKKPNRGQVIPEDEFLKIQQEKQIPTPSIEEKVERIKNIDDSVIKNRYKRIRDYLDKRQKRQSPNIDEETVNIAKALHRQSTPEDFYQAVEEARKKRPDVVKNVSQYTPEEYKNMKVYLAPDKKSGYAIKPDGELVNVFSAEKGLGRGDQIVKEALESGAEHLDAFDGYLPKLYGKHGFEEVKRVPNYTPGEPDVVYMRKKK